MVQIYTLPKRVACLVLLLATYSVLSGCGVFGLVDKEVAERGGVKGSITNAGPNQIAGLEENVSLPKILLSGAKFQEIKTAKAGEKDANPTVDEALQAFYQESGRAVDVWTVRRTRVQDRLLAASEERCNIYKTYLKNFDTETKSFFGVLTTIFAGAGAIATGEINTRALSGLAAITSGAGAEITSAVFANVATHLLIPGIDSKRAEIRKEIEAKREALDDKYTMEAALLDAARFHGACTLDTGLRSASDSISEVQNVGVRRMNDILRMAAETKMNLDAAAKGEPVQSVYGSLLRSNGGGLNGVAIKGVMMYSRDPLQDLQGAIADTSKQFRDFVIAAKTKAESLEDAAKKAKEEADKNKPKTPVSVANGPAEPAPDKSPAANSGDQAKTPTADSSPAKSKAETIQKLLEGDSISKASANILDQLKAQAGRFAALSMELAKANQNIRGAVDKQDVNLAKEKAMVEADAENVKLRMFLNEAYKRLSTIEERISDEAVIDVLKDAKITEALKDLTGLKYEGSQPQPKAS